MILRPPSPTLLRSGPGLMVRNSAAGMIVDPAPRSFVKGSVSESADALDGKDGTNGTNGTDGTDGTNGTNGTDGTNGTNGTDGTNGTNGSDGTNGTNGTDGRNGDATYFENPVGYKIAIVPTSQGPRAMFCRESPEVCFDDDLWVDLKEGVNPLPVDALFMETIEPETAFVQSVVPDRMVMFGAWSQAGELFVQVSRACRARVSICGIRKGAKGVRMPAATDDQMVNNADFWGTSHQPKFPVEHQKV